MAQQPLVNHSSRRRRCVGRRLNYFAHLGGARERLAKRAANRDVGRPVAYDAVNVLVGHGLGLRKARGFNGGFVVGLSGFGRLR